MSERVDPSEHRRLIKEAEDLWLKKRKQSQLPHLYGFPPYKWTLEYWSSTNRMKFLCAGNQLSKAQPLSTLIPTPGGFIPLSQVKVGSCVFGRDGKPTNVVDIPFLGEDQCYEITFEDGDKVISSKDHDWICMYHNEAVSEITSFKWQVKSTQEIFEHSYNTPLTEPTKRYCIPRPEPVQYEKQGLEIEPYTFGVLIGDDSPKRYISNHYLYSSIEDRESLLRGLMDTGGVVHKDKQGAYYTTCSERLVRDLKQLVASLGGQAIVKQYDDRFVVSLWTEFNPFSLCEEKANVWARSRQGSPHRVIASIKPVGKMECKCISVDNEDGSYLTGKEYVVTHNSSTQIRHVIDLATDRKKWPDFFKRDPKTFLYIYPTLKKATEEYQEKWLKEFLPRDDMKNDPTYGWEARVLNDEITRIKFKSGTTVFFKGWRSDLQAYTADAVFIDEEIPANLWGEIQARVTRYDGLISMVFTATLAQAFWYDVIERQGKKGERFPQADKWQISMEYDCRYYADGTPSPWTLKEVAKQKAKCGSQVEIDKRIHGRFVSDEGLAYPSFSRAQNIKPKKPLPRNWLFYSGVDIGSGGPKGHLAAISVVAVRPDFRHGRLVRFWRGARGEYTDTTDILNQHSLMTRDLNMTASFYDHASAEFKIRAERLNIPFSMAEKAQEAGKDLLNVLFKNQILDIDDLEEVDDLAQEFESLRTQTPKRNAKDDGIDSLRFAISQIPWDLSGVSGLLVDLVNKGIEKKKNTRHSRDLKDDDQNDYDFYSEIDEINELMGE